MRRLVYGLAAAAAMAAAGCGGGPAAVEGEVKYDGQPIQNGTIAFIPAGGDAGGKKAGGPIVDGRYAIPADLGPAPGRFKVEVRWNKPTGKKYKSDAGEFDAVAEGLPDKYHDKTELTADLKAGRNEVNFDLKK
jgi:hypothetical protein